MKLWLRLFLITFVCSFLVMFGVSGWFLWDSQNRLLDDAKEAARVEHELLCNVFLGQMSYLEKTDATNNMAGDYIEVSLMTTIGTKLSRVNENKRWICISNYGTEIFKDNPSPAFSWAGVASLMPLEAPIGKQYCWFDAPTMTYSIASRLNDSIELLYERSFQDIFEKGQTQATQILAICGVAIVVLGLIEFFWIRHALRPMTRLGETARVIADGDYDRRADAKGDDEITSLAMDFNKMADAVQARIEDLTQKNIAQDSFIANLTHELKTPMTSIVGFADLMGRVDLDEAKTAQALQYISREGRRLEKMSFTLMELFHLQHSESIAFQRIPMEALLEEIAQTLRFRVEARGQRIEMQNELAWLRADELLIKSLLINLLDNASKASPDGSAIGLRAYEREGCHVIEVRDNGHGIPADEIARVTEPFYMLDKARTRAAHGAGLGLSLCAEIVKVHGGQLDIESAVGQGTTLRALFPPPNPLPSEGGGAP